MNGCDNGEDAVCDCRCADEWHDLLVKVLAGNTELTPRERDRLQIIRDIEGIE